jgi:hypothetical protein
MIYSDMQEAIDNADRCVVCNRPASYRGIYQPENSQRYGAPPGKTRFCIYGLCSKHIDIGRLVGDAVQARFELEYGNNQLH